MNIYELNVWFSSFFLKKKCKPTILKFRNQIIDITSSLVIKCRNKKVNKRIMPLITNILFFFEGQVAHLLITFSHRTCDILTDVGSTKDKLKSIFYFETSLLKITKMRVSSCLQNFCNITFYSQKIRHYIYITILFV
jgi:hypothetical protein